MSITNTAILFVDSEKSYNDKNVAAAKITGVALVTRILNDLKRAKIDRIFVVADKSNDDIEKLLHRSKAEFEYFLFDDTKWRDELSNLGDDKILVLTADRLSDYRFLRKFVNETIPDDFALISVDRNPPGQRQIAETRYFPNEGKTISENELEGTRKTGVNIIPVKAITSFEKITNEYIQSRARDLGQSNRARFFDIENGFVEVIDSDEVVKLTESRLIRYIWKEIDGVHTRPTKRAILPILKFFLKTPLTPNMVSIMGLVVSLMAGYAYSKGNYIATLVGAVLVIIAMVFDHLDGCIARIKSLESDFGAHFDTVCDYVFYLSFGIGVTVGLYKSSHNNAYVGLGIAALFGIVISLITVSYKRKVQADDASLYAHEAHTKLDEDQDPLVRYGRKIYFVMRRGVMPFYLFILTVIGFLPFVLFMTALGSNLFWIYHLYTNRLHPHEAKT